MNETNLIDLRSDTVTRPTPAMRQAMATAEVGDDVLGDDPTVIRLQDRVAELMGKEAALFVPSGSMANQTAIRAQTEPGDEIICHRDSHIYHYEGGAPAGLSGCSYSLLPGQRGIFTADQVFAAIRPPESHYAQSRLVVIENTHNRGGGSIWSLDEIKAVHDIARDNGLNMHLDGARLMNACVATGHRAAEYARYFDTVSMCFSKGLGAPVGSAVAGSAALIKRIHRFRKMFGGGMRQAGVLAAAAIHALDHHVDRLAQDHATARQLAGGLLGIAGLSVDPDAVETNMVYIDLEHSMGSAKAIAGRLLESGVAVLAIGPQRIRAVTHLDISSEAIPRAIRVFSEVLTCNSATV